MANKPRKKIMARKGGRPMKSGRRAPSGALSRSEDAVTDRNRETRDEVLCVARIARAKRLPASLAEYALDPMAHCVAGRTLIEYVTDRAERADLWQAVSHIRRVYVAYGNALGAPSRYAQVARILVPAERFETTGDAPAYDDRDDATKQRQADTAWMQVQGWFGMVSRHAASECIHLCIAMPEDGPSRDPDGFIATLRVVLRGIRGTPP